MSLDGDDLSEMESGFYEKGNRVGDMKRHPEYKLFTTRDLFHVPEPLDKKIDEFQKLLDTPLPEEISVGGTPLELRETGMGVDAYKMARKIHRKLNVRYLLENRFIKPSNKPLFKSFRFTDKYIPGLPFRETVVFMGERSSPAHQPSGFVRIVN